MRHLFTFACAALAVNALAATHELTNSDFTFSPALLTIQAGDQIHLVLADPHTCTQVSEATWNANDNTPLNGGFNFSSGEHTFTLDVPGTYFYVCIPHASMGMKGRIIVVDATGVAEEGTLPTIQLLPNPANSTVQLAGAPVQGARVSVYDMNGRLVLDEPVSNNATLDVSALMPGAYTLMLKAPDSAVILRERLTVVR